MSGKLIDYPDILVKKEVAEILNIGRDKCNNILKSGEIKTLKFGKTVRIRKKDLVEFMRSHSGKESRYA